jgi:ABC-type nitrate/sulfonate/bicarbonate transport system permease component
VTTVLPRPGGGTASPSAAAPAWRSNLAAGATAVVLGVLVWQVLSLLSDGWVPGAGEIAGSAATLVTEPGFYVDALVSLRRVLLVLVAATLIGLVIGLLAGLSRAAEAFLRPVLVIALAIPDPVYIILVILVMGITETAGVVALVIAIAPLVANVVLGSVHARDRSLDEMARTYRLGWPDYARHVLAWQVRPALLAALKTSFAFSWKLVVLMETMTRPDGIGARIYESFRFLRPEDMIAYALLFTVLMRVVEVLALRGVERPHPR